MFLFLNAQSFESSREKMSVSMPAAVIRILPAAGFCKPARIESSVDLPAPDFPFKPTKLPSGISVFRFSKTVTVPRGVTNVFFKFSILIILLYS